MRPRYMVTSVNLKRKRPPRPNPDHGATWQEQGVHTLGDTGTGQPTHGLISSQSTEGGQFFRLNGHEATGRDGLDVLVDAALVWVLTTSHRETGRFGLLTENGRFLVG